MEGINKKDSKLQINKRMTVTENFDIDYDNLIDNDLI